MIKALKQLTDILTPQTQEETSDKERRTATATTKEDNEKRGGEERNSTKRVMRVADTQGVLRVPKYSLSKKECKYRTGEQEEEKIHNTRNKGQKHVKVKWANMTEHAYVTEDVHVALSSEEIEEATMYWKNFNKMALKAVNPDMGEMDKYRKLHMSSQVKLWEQGYSNKIA